MKRSGIIFLTLIFCVVFSSMVSAQVFLNETFDTPGDNGTLNPRWRMMHLWGEPFKVGSFREDGNPCARVDIAHQGQALCSLHTPLMLQKYSGKIKISYRYKTNNVIPYQAGITAGPISGWPFVKQYLGTIGDTQWHQQELFFNVVDFNLDKASFEIIFDCGDSRFEADSYMLLDDVRIESQKPDIAVRLQTPGNLTLFQTDDDQKISVSMMNPDPQTPVDFILTIRSENDAKLFVEEKIQVRDTQQYQTDASAWPLGIYHVQIRGPQEKLFGQWQISKIPPRDDAVIIKNGIPYVHGKPFLMIGLFHVSDPVFSNINKENSEGAAPGQLVRKDVFKQVKDRGFNTVHHSWAAPSKEYLDDAHAFGFKVVSETGRDIHTIEPIKNHPAILTWYGIDEPSPVGTVLQDSRALYNRYRLADPYHPVMTAILLHAIGLRGQRFMDIAAVDDYPIVGEKPNVSMKENIQGARRNLEGDVPSFSTMMVPQLYTMDSFFKGREPTYPQVRAEVYSGIVANAKGFLYYGFYTHEKLVKGMSLNPKRHHWYLPESPLWNQIGLLNKELAELQDPILFGRDISGISVTAASPVISRYMQSQTGRYLLIVNSGGEEQKDIRITGVTQPGTALFGSPTLRPDKDGNTALTLKPYGVALYRWK